MKKKQLVAFLMSAFMAAGTLAGCGSEPSAEETLKQETSKDVTSKEVDASKTDVSQEKESEDVASTGETESEFTLPLTEKKETLTMFLPADSGFFQVYSDYNEGPFFQKLEEITNVHIEFETPVSAEESFNLMIASGELPDIIGSPYLYPDGYDAAIDDGYYLDLTPYLDTCLSNYNKIRTSNVKFATDTLTDTGRAAAVWALYTEPQGPWAGYQIRQDWLDELGLEMPTTFDELEEVLIAFRDKKGAYAPLALHSNGNDLYGMLSAGFGAYDAYMNVDGTVVCGFITEEWREYLKLMNRWYSEGLIDPDFMTRSNWQVDQELVTTGASGVWWAMYTMPATYEATDENMVIQAMPSPKLNEDDQLHIRLQDNYDYVGVAISAKSEKAELAMRWLDFFYTEAGSLFANYGTEGDTFNYDAEGNIVFTDKIMNNPDGLSVTQAMKTHLLVPNKIPSYYDWTRELAIIPEKDVAFYDVWGAEDFKDDYILPVALSYTSEEASERASLAADIDTYFREATSQFIIGVLDINGADWDTYVSTIEGMNVDRVVEITQQALDRYLAR